MYIRTSRPKTKVLYANDERFPVGGSKTLRSSAQDQVTLVAAGVTVTEALARPRAAGEGGDRRPRDRPLQREAARRGHAPEGRGRDARPSVTVEDHSVCGGIGEAVAAAVSGRAPVTILGVREVPRSGKPAELMAMHGLDADGIVKAVKMLV